MKSEKKLWFWIIGVLVSCLFACTAKADYPEIQIRGIPEMGQRTGYYIPLEINPNNVYVDVLYEGSVADCGVAALAMVEGYFKGYNDNNNVMLYHGALAGIKYNQNVDFATITQEPSIWLIPVPYTGYDYVDNVDYERVYQSLKDGIPVMIHCWSEQSQHWAVIYGYSGSSGEKVDETKFLIISPYVPSYPWSQNKVGGVSYVSFEAFREGRTVNVLCFRNSNQASEGLPTVPMAKPSAIIGTEWKDGDISVSTSETARPTISTTNPQIRGWLTYDTSRKFVQGGLFFGTSKTDVENATPSNYTHSGTWFVSDTNESGLPYQTAGSSKRTNLFYDITSAPTDGFGKPSLTPNAYYYKFYARMDNGEVCCSKTFPYIVPAKVTVTQESGGKITQGQSGSYTPGETITLTAVPNSGYSFGHWSSSNGGTFADAKAASTTFIVPKADTTVTAHFSNEPVYAITAAPSTLDFGTLQTGYASVGKTITIQNTGNQTLVLNTQGQPAHFTVTGHGKTTLLPGESTTAVVKPREGLGAGKYDALIYITTNTDIAAAPLNLKLTVLKSPAAITTASLPDAVLGDPYSYALTATGDAPITWTISSGTLPNGLTLAENGNITGIPTVAGKYTFTVKASNGSMADATAELTLLVTSGSVSENSPKLTTKALTGGRVTDYQGTGFAPGTVIYLSALPSEGFEFVRWIPSADGLSIDEAAADITLVMPEENVTLTAVFRVKETDWSETKPANVTCLSKTQYSQRVKQTTTSTTQLSGWTLDQTTYGEWSAWSAWSTTAAAKTELQDVETKTTAATYKTVYKYNHYKYWNSQANTYYYSYGSGYASGGTWEYITLDYPLTAGQVYDGYTSYYYNGQLWFNQTTEQQQLTAAKTEYRYRTRNKIYHYSRWTEWSAWQEAPLTAGSTTEVRQRTLYKPDPSSVTLPYCLRVKKSEQGVISAIGGAYNAGDVIAIKVTPNSGYRFVKWKGDGKAYFADADSPETTLLMTASDTTVSAVYEALLRAEMPGWLTQIEAEAFMGNTHLEYVAIPEQCTSIGERAFAGCTGLYEVHIAHPNAQIADSAFKDCPNLAIYGTNGSTAQQYAQAHSIPFAAE